MHMHYLGPAGTFSEAAADRFAQAFGLDAELKPCPSIAGVVDATAQGPGLGVVPYYNLIDGQVQETLDRVLASGLSLHGALQLPIQMAIGGPPDAAQDAPVYSHPKALAQCSDYLDKEHPHRPRKPVSSTAEGVKYAAAENALGLAAPMAFEKHGVPILNDDVANLYFGRRNYTEFLLIGQADASVGTADTDATRCVLACAPQTDRPGLLSDILSVLALLDMNLARLHSRPAIAAAPTQLDPQIFYLEVAGSVSPRVLDLCMDMLAIKLGGEDGGQVLFKMGEYPLIPVPEA